MELGGLPRLSQRIAEQVTQPVVALSMTSCIDLLEELEKVQPDRQQADVAIVSSHDFLAAARFAARIIALDDLLVHSSLEELS